MSLSYRKGQLNLRDTFLVNQHYRLGMCLCYSVVPNNWGAFTVRYGFLSTANGGFVVDSQVPTNVDATPTGGDKYEVANYSAQRCNGIYGASETVQPAGLYGLYLVRAYEA